MEHAKLKQTLAQLSLIVIIAATVMFTNLGAVRLWDRDEPRNAGCALEMMSRGDLVVPIFNDEIRPQKPVLLYWLMISAYQTFGVNEFAARFWSAILAVGTVLATYVIGRRLMNAQVALFAAIILATSMMFVVAGRAATPDSLLIFCNCMAMMFYVIGTFAPKKNPAQATQLRCEANYFPQNWKYIIAVYAMMGLGVLAKGPVAVVLPCAIIGMSMLIQRLPPLDNEHWDSRGWFVRFAVAIARPFHPVHVARTIWKMRPLAAFVVVFAIAAPWYVLVGLRTEGDWLRMFFVDENFGRATSVFENHRGGIWYYPLAILVGFFPWSVFLGPTIVGIDRQLTRRHRWSVGYSFLICWVVVQVGVFSLAQTKLPSYVTPCYPALALLTGAFLFHFAGKLEFSPRVLNQLSLGCLVLSGALVTAVLIVAGNTYLRGEFFVAVIGLLPLCGGGLAVWMYVRDRNRAAVFSCFALAVLFAIGLFGFASVAVDRQQSASKILDVIAESPNNVKVATFGCLESSWIYYGQKPIYELARDGHEEGWKDDRRRDWHRKSWPSPEQFTASYRNSLIITTDSEVEGLKARLPNHYRELGRADYFLRNRQIILLGPPSAVNVAAKTTNARR